VDECRPLVGVDRVGCVIAGSESTVDRSKGMATRLLRLLGGKADVHV
jgi:3-hydroxy-3-methylglutaryl CoA synthase